MHFCYILIACLHMIGCSLQERTLSGSTNEKNSNISYLELCSSLCLCGLLRHPLAAAKSNVDTFVRYKSGRLVEVRNDDVIMSWFKETTSHLLMTFPVTVLFCQNHPWKEIYQVKTTFFFCYSQT